MAVVKLQLLTTFLSAELLYHVYDTPQLAQLQLQY